MKAVQTFVSKYPKLLPWILILAISTIYSAIIPPLQSPDEFAHLARAYLLSKGITTFVTPPNQSSGGYIDTGLQNFMRTYIGIPFKPNNKITSEITHQSQSIRWTGQETFVPISTAPYFPLIYGPSAIGLIIGKVFDFSIEQSYRIARFSTTIACLTIISLALQIYYPNFLTIFTLILPMSIFQFVTINADALSQALAVLIISLAMRGLDKSKEYKPWMAYALGISLFIIITARWQFAPLVLLQLFNGIIRKNKKEVMIFLLVCFGSALWISYAWSNFVDTRVVREVPTKTILQHYITHPLDTIRVIHNTIFDSSYRNFYNYSFFGALGWLDTYFSENFYKLASIFLSIMIILSFGFERIKNDYKIRLAILFLIISILFLTFFALLIGWSPFPTQRVEGIQGRYFIIPMIILGYALRGSSNRYNFIQTTLGYLFLSVWVIVVSYFMTRVLIYRYLIN